MDSELLTGLEQTLRLEEKWDADNAKVLSLLMDRLIVAGLEIQMDDVLVSSRIQWTDLICTRQQFMRALDLFVRRYQYEVWFAEYLTAEGLADLNHQKKAGKNTFVARHGGAWDNMTPEAQLYSNSCRFGGIRSSVVGHAGNSAMTSPPTPTQDTAEFKFCPQTGQPLPPPVPVTKTKFEVLVAVSSCSFLHKMLSTHTYQKPMSTHDPVIHQVVPMTKYEGKSTGLSGEARKRARELE